ncbi:MAG: hypothetical protein OEN20_13655, partial [Gammaproteobacteria bacterium]|nr:hypothetical protein [Gammaproteobacteria bacterium]
VDTTVGFAVGRIAAVITAGILGGAVLLLIAGLLRSKRPVLRDDEAEEPLPHERRNTSDRRKGDRRLGEHDG